MRLDAWFTAQWFADWQHRIAVGLHDRRYLLAIAVVGFSFLDVLLTQTILTMAASQPGVHPGEANAFMAPIIMTWWAWPIRVGLPILALLRDFKTRNYNLILFAAFLYAVVVAWNTHMLMLVSGSIQ
jgi:hypothetical protein